MSTKQATVNFFESSHVTLLPPLADGLPYGCHVGGVLIRAQLNLPCNPLHTELETCTQRCSLFERVVFRVLYTLTEVRVAKL